MPLKSRLTREPAPMMQDDTPPSQENVRPRRRTVGPTTPVEQTTKAEEAPSVADLSPNLGTVVGPPFAYQNEPRDVYKEAAPAMYGQTAPKQRKQRQARAKPALPEGAEGTNDPVLLRALMRNIEETVKLRRKEYQESLAPLIAQYKLAANKLADLLPGAL